jgi:hypothetical protein
MQILLSSWEGDGLGFCLAGGLQKLEHLTVVARNDAVKAARSEAGTASSEASQRAAKAMQILLSIGEGDGLGFCLAGGLQKLEHLTVVVRNDAVKAARSEAGKASSKASQRAAKALQILLSSGEGDGLGFCLAGGLQKLEHLTAAARNAAVKAARLKASKTGNAACEHAARLLGILDGTGEKGDVVSICSAGGLPVLEHLSLQQRLDAAQEARSHNSVAGQQAQAITTAVFDF